MTRWLETTRFLSITLFLACSCASITGCCPTTHRLRADKATYRHIQNAQRIALGRTEPFTIEKPSDTLRRRLIAAQILPTVGAESAGADALPRIPHWPEKDYPKRSADPNPLAITPTAEPLKITLVDALQIAARNSHPYQAAKEGVFESALALEIESDAFRNSYTGMIEGILSHDRTADSPTTSADSGATAGVTRRLRSGANLAGSIAVDLANLLTPDGTSSIGLVADASISIPLLAGSGKEIAAESLTQAQRSVVYAIWNFERFKRSFAVGIVSRYLNVLLAADQLKNALSNYESQVRSVRQSTALFQENRLSKIELDQVRQAELSARSGWVSAQESFANTMGEFQVSLGLPFDARMEVDAGEFQKLAAEYAKLGSGVNFEPPAEVPNFDAPIELVQPSREGAGPHELEPERAVQIAFDNRLDLRVALAGVHDVQRGVVIAADALKAGLSISASAHAAGSEGLKLRPEAGTYSVGANLDLPWERTAAGISYRRSLIALDAAVRGVQELEDSIKSDIRRGLRRLVQARESYTISQVAVALARQRVDQSRMERDLGRPGVQVRDLLEAQAALLQAQNELSASMVSYRIAELELQLDMDSLRVNEKGLIDEHETEAGQ